MGSKFQQPNTCEEICMWSHSKKYIVSAHKQHFQLVFPSHKFLKLTNFINILNQGLH